MNEISVIELNQTYNSLTILADIDTDSFAAFAELLVAALDCQVKARHWGCDRHQWQLEFEGTPLQLNYQFYGDICWLSVENDDDFVVLEYFAQLMGKLTMANR